LFLAARDLCAMASHLSQTQVRLLNERMRLHALRIFEHASAASSAESAGHRERSLYYARLSLPKLDAVIEVAWVSGQIGDENRAEASAQMARVEAEIAKLRKPARTAAVAAPQDPPTDRVLGAEELDDFKSLSKGDSETKSSPDPDDTPRRPSG
jgi:hypothetical protein